MIFEIFAMPDATSTLSSVGLWSDSMFTNFLPVAYVVSGFIVAGILLNFIIRSVINSVGNITKNKYD